MSSTDVENIDPLTQRVFVSDGLLSTSKATNTKAQSQEKNLRSPLSDITSTFTNKVGRIRAP